MQPHNPSGGQQVPQVDSHAPLRATFLGQQPLDRCCCCFDVALGTGVKVLAGLEIFGGILTLLGFIGGMAAGEEDNGEFRRNSNIPSFLIVLLNTIGIFVAITVGLRAVRHLDGSAAKNYYKWIFFKTIVGTILSPFQTYAICRAEVSYRKERDIDDDEEYDCREAVLGAVIPYVIGLLIGLYFTWVVFSYAARLQAGQVDLCKLGPQINNPGYRHPNYNNPQVVQGIQLSNVNVYQEQPQMGLQGGTVNQGVQNPQNVAQDPNDAQGNQNVQNQSTPSN
eukprot:CAMPEP_0114993510 /NCGR_PEP_ID=MMETSP0216-20121206/12571_1 /TAXON_ID=223996 /ORGANISM="Protocruzia adherens, Strain Boccale" /LENGTH=279 /DNA_ID=CAMNT_0002357163 /DNA_START=214 /DNA_END=1053 /DNA_ORIENTATION=+